MSLCLIHLPPDQVFAQSLIDALHHDGRRVEALTVPPDADALKREKHEATLRRASTVLVLIGSQSGASTGLMQLCTLATHNQMPIYGLLTAYISELPWYLAQTPVIDFTNDFPGAFAELLGLLPAATHSLLDKRTLGDARDAYLNRASLKSQHTISAYRRSIELFLEYLGDRSQSAILPAQGHSFVVPDELPITTFSDGDEPLFLHFAQWLLSPGSDREGDKRPYKPSTVALRVAGVINWFQFLDDYGWFSANFKLAKAKRMVRDEMRPQSRQAGPPQPPEHIDEVIYYYDTQAPPPHLRKPTANPERVQQWELTRLRNRALLHALAETGGRISEILSLNLADFPPRYLAQEDVLRVSVTGKGGHQYYLRFFDSLPAISAYVEARGTNLRATKGRDVPLFVSHDPRYDGNRMSRVVAWRIVQRAAKALGVEHITPHDFRHWRATQLINAGHAIDVVQEYLGHRSVDTTRAYYAHTDPLRVDDAAKQTRLPDDRRDND